MLVLFNMNAYCLFGWENSCCAGLSLYITLIFNILGSCPLNASNIPQNASSHFQPLLGWRTTARFNSSVTHRNSRISNLLLIQDGESSGGWLHGFQFCRSRPGSSLQNVGVLSTYYPQLWALVDILREERAFNIILQAASAACLQTGVRCILSGISFISAVPSQYVHSSQSQLEKLPPYYPLLRNFSGVLSFFGTVQLLLIFFKCKSYQNPSKLFVICVFKDVESKS